MQHTGNREQFVMKFDLKTQLVQSRAGIEHRNTNMSKQNKPVGSRQSWSGLGRGTGNKGNLSMQITPTGPEVMYCNSRLQDQGQKAGRFSGDEARKEGRVSNRKSIQNEVLESLA